MAHEQNLQRRPSTSESSEFTFSEDGQDSTSDDSHDLHPDSDESLLGRWPRRLLHVDRERDVFTSYEWEPGNIYGGHKEPKYNVISYTWGRYTLPDCTRPDVKGIDIGGVTWTIPRIDPDKHFSVADFRAAIKTACATHENSGLKDVQFVWLDVACIDQENYGLKMLEVGRQAVIFQHAESSFIWLASSHGKDLQLVINELWDAFNDAPAPDMAANARHVVLMEKWLENWLERSLQSVEYILEREPWFTSLWTLQEAYLRPFAVMLARDGKVVTRKRKGWDPGLESLRALGMSISQVARCCQRSLALDCSRKDRIRLLLRRIQQTGLQEVLQGNPFLLYKAASSRQTYDKLDRVYGIMQVFGLKLGASNPQKREDILNGRKFPFLRQRFTLANLEMELSQRILETYPVQSHLSVHTSVPLLGQAWRLSASSEIPYFSRLASTYLFVNRGPQKSQRSDKHKQRAMCRFSTTTDMNVGRRNLNKFQRCLSTIQTLPHDKITWCRFYGKATPLATLHGIWKRLNAGDMGFDSEAHTIQDIALDLQQDPKNLQLTIPAIPDFPLVGYEIQNKRQDDLAVRLIERFQGEELLVLCLGTQSRPTKTIGNTIYGVIMVNRTWRGVEYWRRLGIVSWEVFDLPRKMAVADKLTLQVKGNHWKDLEGLYG